jgi:glyoxylase-like metal-dependent hydrolase (beta-lactamase superfamily II)
MRRKLIPALSLGLFVSLGLVSAADAQGAPIRTITEVADNLYLARDNNHHGVFLVTDDGIILADPISVDFATWLKGELEERFGVPVRYVLYSHHHYDHAGGGAVFADTARLVGQENMIAQFDLPPAGTPLPADAAADDANGNGLIERSEATGDYEEVYDLYEVDGDGLINGAEATRGPLNDVRPPDLTYKDRLTLTLGGQSVELIYTGIQTHTDDQSVIVFPEQRTVFVVDFISGKRLPYQRLGTGLLNAWLNSIRLVEQLDFDILAPGHGLVGTKADATAFRVYLEELRDAVAAGITAGRSLEQLKEEVLMEPYRNWINYDNWRALNVEGMYNILSAGE